MNEAVSHIVDVTTQSFMADVIEASKTQLVLLDLWAPWCGPCKQLTPILEKVVAASNGAVRLAKMNIDEEPAVAQQLQVQSIPAVFAFKNGRPIDGFMGALPESQVKEFVERHLGDALGPSPEEALLEMASAAMAQGDYAQAAQAYGQLLQADPANKEAIAGLSLCYIHTGQLDQARDILNMVPALEREREPLAAAQAALTLAEQSAHPQGDFSELEARLAEHPQDLQARYDLALAYQSGNRMQEAIDMLLAIVAQNKEWQDGAARTQLLTVFQALGFDHPLAVEGRKRLSSLLFA